MKIILFGATGNLGLCIAKELKQKNYNFSVVIRNQSKAYLFNGITQNIIIADVTEPASLLNICKGYDVVISALGKSVSLLDKSKPSFYEIDELANTNILLDALRSGIKKFVYISTFHAEKYLHLEFFKVHNNFSHKLTTSGIDYSIIKPTGLFSAFREMFDMAKKGQLINIGNGNKNTNPIFEGDLAQLCVNSITQKNIILEAGGKNIYSRKQLLEIIQQEANPEKSIRQIPFNIFKISLPLLYLYNKNLHHKFSFFLAVIEHDTIAPKVGETSFETYVKREI